MLDPGHTTGHGLPPTQLYTGRGWGPLRKLLLCSALLSFFLSCPPLPSSLLFLYIFSFFSSSQVSYFSSVIFFPFTSHLFSTAFTFSLGHIFFKSLGLLVAFAKVQNQWLDGLGVLFVCV